MPRKNRQDVPGALVHVYARGNNRRPIFMDDVDRQEYFSLLGKMIDEYEWRCLSYCQMTNHVHLIIETPRGGLGSGLCRAHGLYARKFNQRHGRRNHLFGTRYGGTPIVDSEHLLHAAGYVAMNPVKAEICSTPEEWPWSSHAALIGRSVGPRWFDEQALFERIDGLGREPRQLYDELVAFMAGAYRLMGLIEPTGRAI